MADPLSFGVPIAPVGGAGRVYSAGAVSPAQQQNQQAGGGNSQADPPTQLALGTTLEAILRTPSAAAMGLAAGTHLMLRVVAVPTTETDDVLAGMVLDAVGNETLVATPIGILALQKRLAVPPGTKLVFEKIRVMAPQAGAEDIAAGIGEFSALDEALLLLETASPAIADQIKQPLMPATGPDLAGSLLFLWGVLYQGVWPGLAAGAAMGLKPSQRVNRDIAALRKLSLDPRTADWACYTLPFLYGKSLKPIRLYVPRRKPNTDDGTRFAVEVELSVHGPVQLDGLLRPGRLILVVRSHVAIPPGLKQELKTVFQNALNRSGLAGDISFAQARQFLISPLDGLRKHVEISV